VSVSERTNNRRRKRPHPALLAQNYHGKQKTLARPKTVWLKKGQHRPPRKSRISKCTGFAQEAFLSFARSAFIHQLPESFYYGLITRPLFKPGQYAKAFFKWADTALARPVSLSQKPVKIFSLGACCLQWGPLGFVQERGLFDLRRKTLPQRQSRWQWGKPKHHKANRGTEVFFSRGPQKGD